MFKKQIIGQEKIIQELEAMVNAMKGGKNLNIIFSARSGLGKTHIVTSIANEINVDEFVLYTKPDKFFLVESRRFHVFDEAHIFEEPEILYRYMDSGKYTFFFMTNNYGKIVEPLKNRCIHIQLTPYSLEELGEIIYSSSNISEDGANLLAKFSKGSPRIGKILAKRLEILANGRVEKELIPKYLYIIGVGMNGLDENDRAYLTALNKAGGKASLKLLEKLTGFDSNHLQEIESYLIELGKISITSRGRIAIS